MSFETTLQHIESAIEHEAAKLDDGLESTIGRIERLLGLHATVQAVAKSAPTAEPSAQTAATPVAGAGVAAPNASATLGSGSTGT